jgi:hypothetical protein
MRLLPKSGGLRPIVNLSKRQVNRQNYKTSVNAILKNAFHIICLERERKADQFGSAAMGKHDIYKMLKKYQSSLKDRDISGKLYFCKVDIQGCFNKIDQDVLMSLLKNLIDDVDII